MSENKYMVKFHNEILPELCKLDEEQILGRYCDLLSEYHNMMLVFNPDFDNDDYSQLDEFTKHLQKAIIRRTMEAHGYLNAESDEEPAFWRKIKK